MEDYRFSDYSSLTRVAVNEYTVSAWPSALKPNDLSSR